MLVLNPQNSFNASKKLKIEQKENKMCSKTFMSKVAGFDAQTVRPSQSSTLNLNAQLQIYTSSFNFKFQLLLGSNSSFNIFHFKILDL